MIRIHYDDDGTGCFKEVALKDWQAKVKALEADGKIICDVVDGTKVIYRGPGRQPEFCLYCEEKG